MSVWNNFNVYESGGAWYMYSADGAVAARCFN